MHIMKKLILTLLLILFRCIVIKSIRSENEYLWQPIKTIGMEFSSYEIQAYLDHKNMTKCWQLNMNSSCFQSIISKSIWLTILPNITISQPSMKDSQNNYDSRFDWHWSRLNWWKFFCTSLFQGVLSKIILNFDQSLSQMFRNSFAYFLFQMYANNFHNFWYPHS